MSAAAEFLLGSRARAWHALAALTLLYLFATGWNLGIQHIISPDEPRYAVAARTMMHGGDLIVPIFNDHPHLEKPVLFHWLLVVSGSVAQFLGIPLDTAGFRFAPLFMGWLAVAGIYLLGRRLLNQRGAVVAAVILMTSYQFHNVARELVIDMTLTAFLLWSWLFFHVALERIQNSRGKTQNVEPAQNGGPQGEGRDPQQIENRKSKIENPLLPLLGFYLCLGFACMSKGPFLVAIFSTLPLLVYLLWTRRLRLLARAGLGWGLPLSLAVGLSWFGALGYKGYDPTPFFTVENLRRFLGLKDHQHFLPFFFYAHSLFTIFAPWVIFLPFAAWWSYRTWRPSPRPLMQGELGNHGGLSDGAKLSACALGVSFAIMGLSASKRHLYLMPLFPFLALWVAWFVERTFLSHDGEPCGLVLANLLRGFGVALFAGCASALLWLSKLGGQTTEAAVCVLLGALTLAACCAAAAASRRGNRTGVACGVLAVSSLFAFGMEAVARPIHERKLNLEGFYSAVSDKLAGKSLVIVGTNSNEASWYLKDTPSPIDQIKELELGDRFFNSPGTALLVAEPFLRQIPVLNGTVVRISGELSRSREPFVLVVPDPAHPPDLSLLRAPGAREAEGVFDDL